MSLNEIKFKVNSDLGIEFVDDVFRLNTFPEFKEIIKKILLKRVNKGIIWLAWLKPAYFFFPLMIFCVLGFPFVSMVNFPVGMVLFGMFPGSIFLCILSISIKKCWFNRHKYKIKGDIVRKTKGCCEVHLFINTEPTFLNDLKLTEYGSFIRISINKERQEGYKQLREERLWRKQVQYDANRIQQNQGMMNYNQFGAPGEIGNSLNDKMLRQPDPQYPVYSHYNNGGQQMDHPGCLNNQGKKMTTQYNPTDF